MSLLRSPKLRRIRSTLANLRDRFGGKSRQRVEPLKNRHLAVDPLEERVLLSVTPADWQDTLVNQSVTSVPQTTVASQAVATDHDGDFVAVWTRDDLVFDASGNSVTDPATGNPMVDSNIYARYFTDEVQRLTLPTAIATSGDTDGIGGSFSLVANGPEIQKLTLSATYRPMTDGGYQSPIAGTVYLGFDGADTTFTFNESNPFTQTAADLQQQLDGLGGQLNGVKVTGLNPREFLIEFSTNYASTDQPLIQVLGALDGKTDPNFTSGFLPAVTIDTVREPVVIGPINVSANDAYQTANAIEQTFFLTSTDHLTAPVDFPPPDREDPPEGPYSAPQVLRAAVPGVSVRPVMELDPADGIVKPSKTQFDITFDGSVGAKEGPAGKKDHPLLIMSDALDEGGVSILAAPEANIETLKEPSPEFRVNPAEPDNRMTPLPDRYSQIRPDVAMDADGEFVITWQSVVPDVTGYGTVMDVYARRFTPVGIVDPADISFYVDMDRDLAAVEETPIQGVEALDGGFLVNTTTRGAQGQPAIGIDDEGNFVIAWGSGQEGFVNSLPGQDLGYFNGIRAQRFLRDGTPDGGEFSVNAEDTSIHLDAYVAVSDQGNFVITWTETDDEDYLALDSYLVSVNAKVYGSDGTTLINQFNVAGGGDSAAAFDDAQNFIVTYGALGIDNDEIGGPDSSGVRAVMYELFDAGGNVTGRTIRSTFRVNSADFDTGSPTLWPLYQGGSEPALDADGELAIVYEGFGPEVSEDTYLWNSVNDTFRQTLVDLFYRPENQDLLAYYDPASDSFPSFRGYTDQGNYVSMASTNEIDSDIENILIRATKGVTPAATDVQLGRIRALIDQVVGLLRGEADAVMFSSWDASPGVGPLNILSSDNVINTDRSGHNQRYILTIPTWSTGGNFAIRVSHGRWNTTGTANFSPVYNNSVLNVTSTATALETFLEDTMAPTGNDWAAHPQSTDSPYEGPVEVRVVSRGFGSISNEVTVRDGTPWEYRNGNDTIADDEAAYEIVFQGEVHDTPMYMALVSQNRLNPTTPRPVPRLIELQRGEQGIDQEEVSIGMEQDGDFVTVWTQREEATPGYGTNQNIYYRRFTEANDTAGPKMTGLVDHDDTLVANDERIGGPVRHIVLTFDEEMLAVDPSIDADSIRNPENFLVSRGGLEIPYGVAKVEFGMNKAFDLAGSDDGLGGTYPSTWTTSNKWEAVLTLDANGGLMQGLPGLATGQYTVQARAPLPADGIPGLRDRVGNPLSGTGFQPGGQPISRTFVVTMSDPDGPISTLTPGAEYVNGSTHAETPGAVAVDADGDHVVVWTGFDTTIGQDRVYYRLFDADGSPADLIRVDAQGNPSLDLAGNPIVVVDAFPVLPVTPVPTQPEFEYDLQRHGNVAMDRDGDFTVTWTNYRNSGDADIYARRFDATGGVAGLDSIGNLVFNNAGDDPFRVNDYTADDQKWSDVAMDLDGDFVVTWSSYGQESASGLLGTGYGIFARRYDSFGQSLGSEFMVNITTGGNQQSSSVAISGDGQFVIAWMSDQNGLGDDIVAREYNADGSAKASPLTGEITINDILPGNQRYPDVSMRLDAENYIITWTDSAADIYGTSIWAELSRPLPNRYVDPGDHAVFATHRFALNVPNSFTISDVNITIQLLQHARLEDLRITLESPSGTRVMLFEDLPRPYIDGTRPPGNTLAGTTFDDEARVPLRITDSDGGAVPAYSGSFVPQQILQAFDSENARGNWILEVEDRQPRNGLTGNLFGWSLDIDEANASADSFLVNTTRTGNQLYSAVSMDHEGGFTITWSGNGNQPYQEDTSGSGVFYQRFDELATRVELERRANANTAGDQWLSSIGSDAEGNFVIAWTGVDPANASQTEVFKFVSVNDAPALDNDGPLVTDMLFGTQRVLNGDVLLADSTTNVTELTLVFSEDISTRQVDTDGDGVKDSPAIDSVLNPDNWVLTRNGSEIIGGVSGVTYGYNQATRKYEAVVSVDGNGLNTGVPPLPLGDYTLSIKDNMTDVSIFFDPNADPDEGIVMGNRLDGDADGIPGSDPITLGFGAHERHFVIAGAPELGPEFRLNPESSKQYEQRFAEPIGIGQGREESTNSVAVDHDGDFVVVWTSYGQTAGEPNSGDVYLRMYDRNDNPITDPATGLPMTERRVNTFTTGHQRNAAVAMDADGEFVVVWESEGQDPDASWGVYGQRFSSMGQPVGSEFRVNTEFTRNQLNPSVGMDDSGNFVVAWATAGQDFSFLNNVYAQRYNKRGGAVGREFLVNTFDLPSTNPPGNGSFEQNPSVAVSGATGSFVIAWDLVTAQLNGAVTNSMVAARMYLVDGTALGNEFRADSNVGAGGTDPNRIARNPNVTMDDRGNFLVVWEYYAGNVIDAYDIYAQMFDSNGNSFTGGPVNMPQFADNQVNPAVAVDRDGDFAFVWNGLGGQPDPLNPNNQTLWVDQDSEGVFLRSFYAPDLVSGTTPDPVSVQSRVNRTVGGAQEFPSIGMEPDGDMIVVWSGRGVGDSHGIFGRRYNELTDTAGPWITELRLPDGTLVDDDRAQPPIDNPAQLVVVFDEAMWTQGDDSVTNPANWVLSRDGVEVEGAIASITFGLNLSTNKWEATINFAFDLPAGNYTLTALHPIADIPDTTRIEGHSGLRDAVGNPLASSGLLPTGTDLSNSFFVNWGSRSDSSVTGSGIASASRTYFETRGATAVDGDGDHVVVLSSTNASGIDKVFVRMYNADGSAASTLFAVTTDASFAPYHQRYATVAADGDGDFTVTWSQNDGGVQTSDWNVYARRFAANGTALSPAFRVNTYTTNDQMWSDVAMDVDGDFIVTWSSYSQEDNNQLGSGWGIYARRFDSFGVPLASEFRVNVTTAGNQETSAVAMTDLGGFVIVWTSDQNAIGQDVVGRVYDVNGVPRVGPLGGEMIMNDTTAGNQRYPDVAVTPSGNNFVVTWTSSGQDGSQDGVYGQLIDVPLLQQGQVQATTQYDSVDVGQSFGFGRTVISTLTVPDNFPDNFALADVDLEVSIRHGFAREVEVRLVSPAGTSVLVFENVPRNNDLASDFSGTLFDDEALLAITDPRPGLVVAPFIDPLGYLPMEPLNTFDGQLSSGTWRLIVQDTVRNVPPADVEVDGTLAGWSLLLTRVPARSGEFPINTTTVANQEYSSVAMNRQGEFVVTWSGAGNEWYQEDSSGVYFQRFAFNGQEIGGETRANIETNGDQSRSSVDSDGAGNFVVAFTGTGSAAGTTDVYRFLSTDFTRTDDTDGPVVTDVQMLPGGPRIIEGDVLETSNPITSLTVVFSENLSTRDGAAGLDSVLNPDNWILERDGVEVPDIVRSVSYTFNAATRKYEATLSLDGNGLDAGMPGLLPGSYQLTVRDSINDAYSFDPIVDNGIYFLGNALDGDFDGSPGTLASGTGHQGFLFNFSVDGTARLGAEYRVNQNTSLEQRNAAALGTGYAREQSNRSVAVDHDGDFAVVWTSYGQDDLNDPNGAGVFMRMYDRDDNPLTDEVRVNSTTAGHQRNASVAIDADGEFVVVWEGQNDNVDGSWGVFGRRFSSIGAPLSGEFRVNTTTQNDQLNPAVSMDDFGNFVVVWASAGQSYSFFNDVRGQLFNASGDRIASEFLVNQTSLPGTGAGPGSIELNPAVAMNGELGTFVVVWDQIVSQTNGVVIDSEITARLFNADGTVAGPEFTADSGAGSGGADIERVARNPQAIMDDQGNFLVVWEGFVNTHYDVFYQLFDAAGGAIADDQANEPEQAQPTPPLPDLVFDSHQVNPSVAVDADGDFAIVWDGKGAQPDPLDPTDLQLASDKDTAGVFVRQYHASAPGIGPASVTVQSRVNRTESGVQQFASIGMEPDGDHVVVWSGAGVGDRHGVFARRYNEATDTAGPRVSDLEMLTGDRLDWGSQLTRPLNYLVVVFDEEMMTTGPDSVTNPDNYVLLRDGVEVVGGIRNIEFGLDQARATAIAMGLPDPGPSNKWEAVLELDGNGGGAGVEFLGDGHYEIVIQNTLRDRVGNPLGSTSTDPGGQDSTGEFDIVLGTGTNDVLVNDLPAGGQIIQPAGVPASPAGTPRAIAADADGEYVSVWTDTTPGQEGIYAKVFNDLRWSNLLTGRDSSGPTPGGDLQVTSDPTASFASVDRDEDGDFVVTWSQNDGSAQVPDWNIWARRYDAVGRSFGSAFMVNSETTSSQRYSAVAMDVDGDFVITWQSLNQDGSGYGIYAQRFSPSGAPIGGVDEVQVLNFMGNPVGTFGLSWDGDNDPSTTNTTGAITYDGNTFAVAQEIENQLNALGNGVNYVAVTAVTQTEIIIEFLDSGGSTDQRQIVLDGANTSFAGDPGATIVVSTRIQGATGEFLVNESVDGNQTYPSVAMSKDGDFVITWTSSGIGSGSDVYARQFPGNDVFGPSRSGSKAIVDATESWAQQVRKIVSTDPITNHVVNTGTGYDGVVEIAASTLAGVQTGSGSLLRSGYHILTAAHVVWDMFANTAAGSANVQFETSSGVYTINSTQVVVHPQYDPFNLYNDIALIVLPQQAPAAADRYQIYRGSGEVGRQIDIVGYGLTGQGLTGQTGAAGTRHRGLNVYETLGDPIDGMPASRFNLGGGSIQTLPGTLLVYDFDNGLAANDALGDLLGIDNLGLGQNEAIAAQGDSGGPNFIDGQIAGVVSFGLEPLTTDIDPGNFVTFGELQLDTRISYYADWIDSILGVQPVGTGEFLVNDTTANDQRWSTVAMDSDGDFVISWTSYGQDEVGSGFGDGYNGVYAKRYNFDATEVTDPATGMPLGEFAVNSFTGGHQQRPQIGMDADGDFIITWESYQDGSGTSFGVYAQRYVSSATFGSSPFDGPNGENGGELSINNTKEGPQRFPSIALDDTGDSVYVWAGTGLMPFADRDDAQGIFYQRFEKQDDEAGPTVADVINVVPDGNGGFVLEQVLEDGLLDTEVSQFLISFGENLVADSVYTPESVTNPGNWVLTRDGAIVTGGVASIEFGLNQTSTTSPQIFGGDSNKYEAIITFDGDYLTAGNQALGGGVYVLTLRDRVVDQFDNRLDGDYDGTPGSDFGRSFRIGVDGDTSTDPPGPPEDEDDPVNDDEGLVQESPAVAANADGDYVIVWVDRDVSGNGDIVGRRFNRLGEPLGTEFFVNSYQVGNQEQPAVAMDAFGNFVVSWSGEGVDTSEGIDDDGIFARVFYANGAPDDVQFPVNQYRQSVQDSPSVSMDSDGDFVVTWTSYGQDGDKDGVYARRYSFSGVALDDEFAVNVTTGNRQAKSDVASDALGNFVIVWAAYRHPLENNEWGVFGQRFDVAGTPLGSEFQINTYTNDDQRDAHVAMDSDGDFVVSWSSFLQDGSGWGVYGRRYDSAGIAQDVSEFRVNETTLHWQFESDVSMDDSGNFVVTWTTTDQDNQDAPDEGIFARIYNAAGGNRYVDSTTGLALGEFSINGTVTGDQDNPAVASDADGDFVVVWTGPDSDTTGIYGRLVNLNTPPPMNGSARSSTKAGGFYVAEPGDSTGTGGGGTGGESSTNVLGLMGTAGDDHFEFVGGATRNDWVVRLNGVAQSIGSSITSVAFDGGDGNDSVTLTGTAGKEELDLSLGYGTFKGPSYFVSLANVESVTATGGGGDDVARLLDDPSQKETLSTTPGEATLSNATKQSQAVGFPFVHVYSTGGGDIARLLDDATGYEIFTATPESGTLHGENFLVRAAGFSEVHAVSRGGRDTAKLHGELSGIDLLEARPDEVTLSGSGYLNRAESFATVNAYAEGLGDEATFYDDPAHLDVFTANPSFAKFTGPEFWTRAAGFSRVQAISSDRNDVAKLFGSHDGDDTFTGAPGFGLMEGDGFYNLATSFRTVRAYSNGGNDIAKLYDDPNGDETLTATPENAVLFNGAFYAEAVAFPAVHAFSSGGADMAILYDDPNADETFEATPDYGTLYSNTYLVKAVAFPAIDAYSRGGNDLAELYDSSEDDTFVGFPDYGAMFNADFRNRVLSFDTVKAYATGGGRDTAYLNDWALAAYPDHIESDSNWAHMSNSELEFDNWAIDFDEVFATSKNANDTRDVAAAVDFLLIRDLW